MSKLWGDCRAAWVFESKGFDFTFIHLSAGMLDNFSTGISGDKIKKKNKVNFSSNQTKEEYTTPCLNILLLPVMLFPSRLILSSVAISVSLSGKMEKLLLARLMLVKCSISPTLSGSLVRTLPCRSSSAKYFQTRVNRGVTCLFLKTFCQNL